MQAATSDSLHAAVGGKQEKAQSPADIAGQTRARANYDAFLRAFDSGHSDWIKLADKQDNFYQGEQWEADTVATLEAEGKPHLTLNMILAVINTLLGEQSSKRVDIQYRNKGTAGSGMALTKLAMAISEANQYKYVESEVFADGVICDRGWFDIRMDFTKSIKGSVKIISVDPREVLPDPDAKSRDPQDWRQVIRSYWVSMEDIKHTYGEEAYEKVRYRATSGNNFGNESMRFEQTRFGNNNLGARTATSSEEAMVTGVRVVDRQYREYVCVQSLVDPETGDYKDLPLGTTEEEAKKLAATFNTYAVCRSIPKIRWTVSVDEVELKDSWSPYRSFTLVPYFPYFRRGKPMGVVRNLLSPQEQFNKISSQELHIINSTANSGWTVEQGTLTNMTVDEFVEQASTTGLVLEHARGSEPPRKIQPNAIPTGLDRFGMKSQALINDISGISSAMMGLENSPEVSGVALESMERRGGVQIQLPLDNLAFTRMLIAQKQLELIKDFYTDERDVTVMEGNGAARTPSTMTINKRNPDGTVENDVTDGEFDVVISTMPDHETYDDIQFAQLLNLRKVGVNVPDYYVIMHSKLDGKEEISAIAQQMAGLGEKSPEQQDAENMQREIAMRGAMLEIEKLQAEVDEIKSQAMLNQAKAQDIPNANENRLQKLEQDMAKKREELKNIMQRHLVTNQTKRVVSNEQAFIKQQSINNPPTKKVN